MASISATHSPLNLKGFEYSALFNATELLRLDETFLSYLNAQDTTLCDQLRAYRSNVNNFSSIEISNLLIAVAKVLEAFLAELFGIEEAVAVSQALTTAHNPISAFKKYYVLRRAKKELNKAQTYPTFAELNHWLNLELQQAQVLTHDRELAIALLGNQYLFDAARKAAAIEKLVQWCVQALATAEGQRSIAGFRSFQIPERIDYQNLVPAVKETGDKTEAPPHTLRYRDGFKLTDARMTAREVQDEVNYCIYCHDHEGDFCSRGFPQKKGDPTLGFKKNPLDVLLVGCPLEEKISEMQFLKKDGYGLGSLAVVMIDNPMCPATGHRICNECMKACIYQKQDPVNIPQIETRVLTDVLDLPWGVEIYDLLTRWNPLRQHQWVMKPYNGLKVMIAGMGPAGFTLAHHLLLEGFAVVGFDGLKIEPLPKKLIDEPIRHFAQLKESLDERLMAGFGGVAEYGITVRWDKNFLKLIYLSLARKPHFQVFGGVRFGGTITVEDAWELGFDHLCVAVGAGLPKALPIPGSLAPGMRQANDFLMALQLGNAAKKTSLTNLQIRLPAVVIGGGLTGVDTATELQAYYISLVEKILLRFETLKNNYGEQFILETLDVPSRNILNEYLQHGEAVRLERERAKQKKETPNFIKLVREWGGVTIVYRRRMQESPAYVNNHEELKKALEEGIYYLEGLEPNAVSLDDDGHAKALICNKRLRDANQVWITTAETVEIKARSILVATGTQPNTAYEFEHRGTFNRINLQYQHYEDESGALAASHGVIHCKDPEFGPFTSYQKSDLRVSLVGDTHPVFHGSVVKAIASGLRTYPKILEILQDKLNNVGDYNEYKQFAKEMKRLFAAQLINITRKNKDTLELTIEAPIAAKHFKPGEFYRLQNYETGAKLIENTLLQMEPLALVTADCDHSNGRLTFIVKENTATAKLCSLLKQNELVSLMGPTGVRAKIPNLEETILIIGDHFSLPFLRAYGTTLRKHGNRVLYLGSFATADEIYDTKILEKAADVIIWQLEQDISLPNTRTQDLIVVNPEPIDALHAYHKQTNPPIALSDVDRIYVVGKSELLRSFQFARKTLQTQYFVKQPSVYGSVYGNMQCMLKGVCAQCLQWQVDPETGKRTKAVFACSWQDQPLEIIDINHIDERQSQNKLLDTLSNLWVTHLFKQHTIARV